MPSPADVGKGVSPHPALSGRLTALDPGRGRAGTEAVPRRLCAGLPVLVFVNILMLLIANLVGSVRLKLDVTIGGQAPLFDIEPHQASRPSNFPGMVALLSHSGGWFLATVTALSGLWPYIKLLGALLIVHLVHSAVLTRRQGQGRIELLETIGRFSWAKVILHFMNLVIFRISSRQYDVGMESMGITIDRFRVQMSMELGFVVVTLICAVMTSSFLLNWAAHELGPSPLHWSEDRLSILRWSHTAAGRERIVSHARAALALLLAVVAGAFLIIGVCFPVIRVERSGFVGMLMQEGDRNLELSVLKMAQEMGRIASGTTGDPIVYLFVLAFLLIVLVAPLLELLLLALSAGCLRFSSVVSRWSLLGAKWIHSISCVDVLLFVALGAVYEMQSVVDYNLENKCKLLAPIISSDYFSDITGLAYRPGEPCLRVATGLGVGFWFLLLSTLLRFCVWRLSSGRDEALDMKAKSDDSILYGSIA